MIPLLATASGLLLRGALFRTVGLMAQLLVAFFLTPFIIEAIGQRYYGMWALIGTIVGYYGYLDFGLSKAVQYFIARAVGKADTIEMHRIVATAVALFALLGVVALAASLVVASSAPWFLDDPVDVQRFRIVMLIMGANVLCAFPMMALNGLFSAHLRYDLISGLELAKFALRTALIVYFLGHGYSIVALATIQTLVDFAGHLTKLLMARRLFAEFTIMYLRPSKELLRPLFAYGGKAFTHSAADLLRFQVDDLVVVYFLNLTVVAVYAIAAQLVSYFRQLLGMIFGVIVPVYAQYSATNDTAKMKQAFVFSSKLAAALSVLLGGNAIVFGEPFIAAWLGPAFAGSYGVLVILILAAMVHVAQEPGLALIYGIARHGAYAKVAIIEGMVNLGLSLILVGPYGPKGVALGTAIPMLLSAGYVVWYATRYLEYSVVDHLKSLGGIVLLAAVCHVLVWQLVQHHNIEGFAAIFTHAAVILPMEGALFFLVGFTSLEREVIYRSIRMMMRPHAKVETGSRAL